ncbi:MAG TPA: hypothetical protein VIY49_39210 [Bryobacteraceae bacterium]
MRRWKVTSAILALASSVVAQNAASHEVLLTRIRAHMREELSRLPNYTCLETTDRFYRFLGRQKTKLRPLDTVRLEIVYSDRHEWYAAPGDKNFSETDPFRFITRGMIGNGIFGVLLDNILLSGGATFSYRGEERLEGQKAIRYDYRRPRALGGFEIEIPEGKGLVGEQGSFWADLQSLDLIRIFSHAVEVPAQLPVQARRITVSYARTRISDSNVLLAQEGDMYLLTNGNEEQINHVEFSHCRAFIVQSAIRFDSDDRTAKPAAEDSSQVAGGMRPMGMLPEDLPVTLQLTAPVTQNDAVGTLISAKTVDDVLGNNTFVKRGSIIRGRIRDIERQGRGFWVSLEFTEIGAGGPPLRFYADLRSIQSAPGIQPSLLREFQVETGPNSGSEEKITMPELPGVASFFIPGGRLSVPGSLRMTWITRSLTR